jgi:hypothetical protein
VRNGSKNLSNVFADTTNKKYVFSYNIYSTKYDPIDEETKIYVRGIVDSLMHVTVINCSFYVLNSKHYLPLNYRQATAYDNKETIIIIP